MMMIPILIILYDVYYDDDDGDISIFDKLQCMQLFSHFFLNLHLVGFIK